MEHKDPPPNSQDAGDPEKHHLGDHGDGGGGDRGAVTGNWDHSQLWAHTHISWRLKGASPVNLDQSALGPWQPVPGRTRCEPSPLQLAFVLAPANESPAAGGSGAQCRREEAEERGTAEETGPGPRAPGRQAPRPPPSAKPSPTEKSTTSGKGLKTRRCGKPRLKIGNENCVITAMIY